MDLRLLIIIGIALQILFFIIKNKVWDKPQREILQLKRDIEKLQKLHKDEILELNHRLKNNSNLHIKTAEFSDIVASYAWREIAELCNRKYAFLGIPKIFTSSIYEENGIIEPLKKRFSDAIEGHYKYLYLVHLFPELSKIFHGTEIVLSTNKLPENISQRSANLFDVVNILRKNSTKSEELIYWKNRVSFLESTKSNLTAIPYMAAIIADYETYGLEHLASELDWGYAYKRAEKVKAIREIRKDAQLIVERNKESQYQLAYILNLLPVLEDIVESEYNQLPAVKASDLSEYDSTRDYLSKEEYRALNDCERNQLALDRYKKSHSRTKWQIGRDYELFVGYKYSKKGYSVDYFGSYMGLEDLGRDIIAKKGNRVAIIQCKYWSAKKQIHENHINQLFGTKTCYCIEHSAEKSTVSGILITNIKLSPMAKKMASYLGIEYIENLEMGDYPCIKCNIGRGEYGERTKIYHLPFDQQYDSTKIKNKGEFYAMTVAEAENAGFRRAFKWFGTR